MTRKRKIAKMLRLVEATPPTPEQARRGMFEVEDITDKRNGGASITIGKAYRRRPMIDILAEQGLLSDAEHKALGHYRHHADMVDRSLTRDSMANALCSISGTSDRDPSVAFLAACVIVRDVERAAGSLVEILRAVVVYDRSLSDWAMEHGGSVEQCRDRRGKRVCTLEPRRKALQIAQLDIQMAAKRVEAELRS